MSATQISRTLTLVAATSLLAAAALMAPAAPAVADPAPISALTVSGLPKTITVPTTGSTVVGFTVQFSGPEIGGDVFYDGKDASNRPARVTKESSRVAKPILPGNLTYPEDAALQPDTALAYSLQINVNTSPGLYKLTVPITESYLDSDTNLVTATATKTVKFTVVANAANSSEKTDCSMSGRFSKTARFTTKVFAPEYQRGATVKIYYKASGAAKYSRVGTSKLNSHGKASFKTTKGKIRRAGTIYLKIGAVSYAPGYRSPVWYLG